VDNDWETVGRLIEEHHITVRHIEEFPLSVYPGNWIALLKKSDKVGFTVSAWGQTAMEAVLNVYNKSILASPENLYNGMKVYIDNNDKDIHRPWALRKYEPNTKQHGQTFDIYMSKEQAIVAAELYQMEIV
jgi:hypothetical protein